MFQHSFAFYVATLFEYTRAHFFFFSTTFSFFSFYIFSPIPFFFFNLCFILYIFIYSFISYLSILFLFNIIIFYLFIYFTFYGPSCCLFSASLHPVNLFNFKFLIPYLDLLGILLVSCCHISLYSLSTC